MVTPYRESDVLEHILAVGSGLYFMLVPACTSVTWGDDSLAHYVWGFAAAYAFLGGLFGYLRPEGGWCWGVWVSVAPVNVLSFFGLEMSYFLTLVGLTLLPACAGAYAGATAATRRI